MFSIVRSALTGYLVTSGLVVAASVVGRGLVRSARHLSEGRFAEAGTQVLSALAAPALLAHAATAVLVCDVIAGASDLVGDVIDSTPESWHDREAA